MNADTSFAALAASAVVLDLVADSNPGLLPRLLQTLARRSLVPQHFAAERAETSLRVRIVLSEISPDTLSLIEGNLRQVVGVRQLSCRAVQAPASLAQNRRGAGQLSTATLS